MSRETFTRFLAISAIVIAFCAAGLSAIPSGGGKPGGGWVGRALRYIAWCAFEEEFRPKDEPRQDPGVLRQENLRPQRLIGADGAKQLDHGRGW